MPAIFGRAEQLLFARRFLEPGGGPKALILEGEAGIGKTAVWEAALDLARAGGWRVLASRPAASEAQLSFAALRDLLESIVDDYLGALPAPQARGLAAALLVVDAEPVQPDPGLLGMATLGLLRAAAADRDLLIAVDDGQWLDPASAIVLAHALRRVRSETVAALQTLRSPHADLLELERARPNWKVDRLTLGPLDVDALHTAVRARLGVAVPRPTMRRVHEISGGNPFFAFELIRSLPTTGGRVSAQEVPLPRSLLSLVEDRLRSFEDSVRDVLAATAALASPTLSLLAAAFPGAPAALATAEREEIVQLEGERIRFSHPLLAAAALETMASLDRARLHGRLAAVVTDPEQRARHLAEATLAPDEDVAAELQRAAAISAARGAPRTAAELLERAVRLTPSYGLERFRREAELARQLYIAGDADQARQMYVEVRSRRPAGLEGARMLLDSIATCDYGWQAIELAELAIANAEGDAACLADAHRWISYGWSHGGDVRRALEHARKASQFGRASGDDKLLIRCLAAEALFETYSGKVQPGLLERAVELEQQTSMALMHRGPTQVLGLRLMYEDRLAAGRPLLERVLERAETDGDEPERATNLYHLTRLEIRAGNWATADAHATELFELDSQVYGAMERSYFVRALVGAHLGRVADVRATLLADEQESMGTRETVRFYQILNRWVLGLLELSLGRLEPAAHLLRPLPEKLERMGYGNPAVHPVQPDAIEALVGVGELAEARSLAERLAEQGRALDNPWALATAARCLGLIAAAEGDLDRAIATLQDALVEHDRSENPFERYRTLLALGATLRRAKRKRDAREALAEALGGFDMLGAALWAEKTAAELARIGGRQQSGGGLSPTERRIAELVAQGKPNKAIADELYVTVRTVETHIRHIYDKLGVHSRAELAGRIAREGRTN